MKSRRELLCALALGLGLFTSGAIGVGATESTGTTGFTASDLGQLVQTGAVQANLAAHALHQAASNSQQQASDPAACAADQQDDTAQGDIGETADDPADTDNLQDENGQDDATEQSDEEDDPNDTDDLQCGDQTEGSD